MERTFAVLDLPGGLLLALVLLLRVVTERLANYWSMGRPACGGVSPIDGMLICVLSGEVVCNGRPHELCAMDDGCMSEPEI